MLLIINNTSINTQSICKQNVVVFECEKLIISKNKDTWGYLTEYNFYIFICFNNDEDLQRDIDEKLSLIQQTFIII